MSWDPEINDPSRPRPAEDPAGDYGADHGRDFGDEPPPAWRTEAPNPLAPIDPDAPVSGHVPPRESHGVADAAEHDWGAARGRVHPVLRPVGTQGIAVADATMERLAAEGTRSHHSQPILSAGPVELAVAFVLPAEGFDIIVNADHVLSWAVPASEVEEAAMANLAAWSAGAGWTEEEDGGRRLLSSDTGDGWDAARILLPEVRRHLASSLGSGGARVLVGLPERHLLVAGSLAPEDAEFAGLFSQFVVETSGGADEPVDRRVFELVGDELVPFTG